MRPRHAPRKRERERRRDRFLRLRLEVVGDRNGADQIEPKKENRMNTLTDSQRILLEGMLRRGSLTEYERGQVAAWKLRTTEQSDRALLDQVAGLEVK